MEKKQKIVWTTHFRERLFERFAINLNESLEEIIIKGIREKDSLTTLPWDNKVSKKNNNKKGADVHQVTLIDEEVMILSMFGNKGELRIITALRKSWFCKDSEGNLILFKKSHKKKGKRNRKRDFPKSRQMKHAYKKKEDLLESDCESGLI